jgi:hypothetical protein
MGFFPKLNDQVNWGMWCGGWVTMYSLNLPKLM